MFTSEERARIRADLLERSAQDPHVSGAAITGSAAAEREDAFSDIDLAFGIEPAGALPDVMADWTRYLYQGHHALHHLDVRAGAWIYRVFLLASTLQVDLAFVPAADFRARAATFRLVHGRANPEQHKPPPAPEDMIGLAWLHALHARSSIARRRLWQAEYMISGVRDHTLALACLRHGLPASEGRGLDQLPPEVTAPFQDALVRRIDREDLLRALRTALDQLLVETRAADPQLAESLEPALLELGRSHEIRGSVER